MGRVEGIAEQLRLGSACLFAGKDGQAGDACSARYAANLGTVLALASAGGLIHVLSGHVSRSSVQFLRFPLVSLPSMRPGLSPGGCNVAVGEQLFSTLRR